MPTRFCPYCRQHREDVGFKPIFHLATQSKRMQCTPCQDMRKQPRGKLTELAKQDGDARRQLTSEAMKRGIENKRRKNDPDFGNK